MYTFFVFSYFFFFKQKTAYEMRISDWSSDGALPISGLNETAFYDPANFTYPAGTHICEIEVDPATGVVRVDRFTAVDDFGVIVNPMIVEGQVQGGIMRSEERRVGKECVSTCRSRWSPYH